MTHPSLGLSSFIIVPVCSSHNSFHQDLSVSLIKTFFTPHSFFVLDSFFPFFMFNLTLHHHLYLCHLWKVLLDPPHTFPSRKKTITAFYFLRSEEILLSNTVVIWQKKKNHCPDVDFKCLTVFPHKQAGLNFHRKSIERSHKQ